MQIPFYFFFLKISEEFIKAIVALREIKEPCEIVELERAAETGYQMHVGIHCSR